MAKRLSNDSLIALFKDKTDFLIARDQGWYRIPTSSRIPLIMEDGSIRFGGLHYAQEDVYRYVSKQDGQLGLFD
ncbi:MAG: hypothetical protein LH609_14300 [Rudanella sp.]|nr:hypothetical protein [Rudanella sp.]